MLVLEGLVGLHRTVQLQLLQWEDPLKESMATHSSILAWRIPRDRGAWRATVHVGYLLLATAPDLGCGVAPLGCTSVEQFYEDLQTLLELTPQKDRWVLYQ